MSKTKNNIVKKDSYKDSPAELSSKPLNGELSDEFTETSNEEALRELIDKQNDENAALRYNNPISAIKNSQEILKQSKEINYVKGQAKAYLNIASGNLALGDAQKAIEYSKIALDHYAKIDNKAGIASTYGSLSSAYSSLGDYELALRYAFEALKFANEISNERNKAYLLNNIGNIHEAIGDYEEALDYYFQSLELKEKINEEPSTTFTLMNIGLVYIELQDYEKAREYLNQGLRTLRKLKNLDGMANVINNLGMIESHTGNYKKAVDLYSEVVDIRRQLKDRKHEAGVLINLAYNLHKTGKVKEAMNEINHAMKILNEIEMPEFKSTGYSTLGDIYLDEKQYEEAYYNYTKALEIAKKIKNKKLIFRLHSSLSDYYERKGDYKKALEEIKTSEKIQKDLITEKTLLKTKSFNIKYEVKKFREEKAAAEKKSKEIMEALKKVEHLNKKLIDLDKDKNEMIGIVAHDMRNPVSTIIMITDQLLEDFNALKKEELVSSIEDIKATSEKMLNLLKNILNLNLIEAGKIELKPTKLNLVNSIKKSVDAFKKHAQQKNINLIFNTKEKSITAKYDKDAFSQILDNLLSNAIKFTPKNKNVFVNVSRNEKIARIEIIDEGEGIRKEEISKLFQKYSRLSSTPTGGETSNGLGLSIAKKFTEEMHGRLWCESVYGKGAKFVIELPVMTD
ncbi:MAG TPA: tetratricopeptide repeat-containing sensor histidine kinase [Ignavibacteria bacterium]|nr:tetratricopeptide repeat-containing sensor histidine kinase [Ignavibacteria bacterium]